MNARVIAFAIFIATIIASSAQEGASSASKDIIGTWVLVGTPDKIGEIPSTGGRLKLITPTHWVVTQADPKTNIVIFHHGGTYSIKGGEYLEAVKFANENTADLIGKVHTFKIKVEGDTLTQIGVGNPWNEVWKRLR